ncbi:MAG: hypothetical protein CR988_00970 [Treponema sp.]|nr:MAG: hypothetical protein CR988_00970 [Treponema sp.]
MKKIQLIWQLLTPKQKKDYILTQGLIIISSFFEVAGVSTLVPFIGLFTNPDIVHTNKYMKLCYNIVQPESYNEFITIFGMAVIALMISSSLILSFSKYQMVWFGSKLRHDFSSRLKDYYMDQNYLFHVNNNSAELINTIIVDIDRFSKEVIYRFLRGIARALLALFFLIGFILISPLMALGFFSLIGGGYFLIYRMFKSPLSKGGKIVTEQSRMRMKFLNEGFGGIKDLKILGKEEFFKKNFRNASWQFNRNWSRNDVISYLPKFLLEAFVISSLVGLMLVMVKVNENNLTVVLPILSFYAIAGYKLLPAVNAIYESISIIKANISVLYKIAPDLIKAKNKTDLKKTDTEILPFEREINIQNLSFAYPGTSKKVINSISLKIPKNNTIALIGSSGSGKTTLVDIILGLLEPQSGKIIVDGTTIHKENIRSWQNILGYVPQSIYLSDATIAQNIAFGTDHQDINWSQIDKVLKLADLDGFVHSLAKGIHTTVGERGIQLSGGQRQRIGIARALYHDASVLIFDEATSALDGITENRIMKSINSLARQKTIIIIAHRLTTVKEADCIYLLGEGGRILDQGKYGELMARNREFQKMSGQDTEEKV